MFSFSELALSDVPAILAAGAAITIIMYLSHVSRQGNVNQAEIKFKFALTNILIATTIIFALEHSGILYRMPIHSLAVVIIVGAWQSVEWGKIGKSIKGGAASGIIMIISAAMPILAGPSEAVLILLLLSAALAMHDRRKELSRS